MPRKRIKLKAKPVKRGKSFTEQVTGPLEGTYQDVRNLSSGVQKAVKKIPGAPRLPRK